MGLSADTLEVGLHHTFTHLQNNSKVVSAAVITYCDILLPKEEHKAD